MHQTTPADGTALVQRLLERIEDEAGVSRP